MSRIGLAVVTFVGHSRYPIASFALGMTVRFCPLSLHVLPRAPKIGHFPLQSYARDAECSEASECSPCHGSRSRITGVLRGLALGAWLGGSTAVRQFGRAFRRGRRNMAQPGTRRLARGVLEASSNWRKSGRKADQSRSGPANQ